MDCIIEDLLDSVSEGVIQSKQRQAKKELSLREQMGELIGVLSMRMQEQGSLLSPLVQAATKPVTLAGLAGKSKRVSLGQPSQRIAEPNAAVNSDESDDAASEASHQTAQSSHPQTHRERKEQKGDFQFLVARLKAFKQGQNFDAWQAFNIAALAELHHLPQTLLINAVEQKLDTKLQRLMEPMMAKVRTLKQFLTVLGASFGPDTMNLNKRLGSVQQQSGQKLFECPHLCHHRLHEFLHFGVKLLLHSIDQ